ncbi:MAG TPA: M48 family metalloprotease [Balneolaceae bacterium]|nr:M48 family metalloprotease [Balneolaceae bacterium]
MKTSYIRNGILIILVGFVTTYCVVQKSLITGNKRAYGYSWEKEKEIGKQADQQIQQQYGVYDNQEVSNYVKNVGQKILSVSHLRRQDTPQKFKDTEFHYQVLNSPVANAFALPGGYVYITRGLLGYLENEAQLAVVLGHETGHVAARHASQQALEQQVGQIALIGGAVAGQELLGVPGQSILNLGSQAAKYLFLSYSRDDEREADRLGVEYAAMEHYQAKDAAGFFEALKRLTEQSGQSIPDWQSTHPDPSERAKTIPELAQQWKEKGYEQNIEDADKYMRTIDGIIYGDNPREGFARDGKFYHPDLKFQFSYPDGWQVVNQPNLVAVVNKDQDAVSIMQLDSKSSSPQASVIEYVSQDGYTVQSQGEVKNNGLNGYEAIASATADNGTEYQFYVYSVSYNKNIYRFISYCVVDKFAAYKPLFVETSNSFKALTDQSILDIKPVRLHTIKVDKSAPFSSFLPEKLPMDITQKEIAILNQVKLDETIQKGSWIKIPKK